MANIVIVGMQWGDEGKGKIVDVLCPGFDVVARYQGGHNAGHTVRFGEAHFSLHLIPSGILHAGMRCVLGNGMVIAPDAFLAELDKLDQSGVDAAGRLFVSDRAHLLTEGHVLLDQAREEAKGEAAIGTTARGIGPAYEGKLARSGLRMCDLSSPRFEVRLRDQLEAIGGELRRLGAGSAQLDGAAVVAHLLRVRERLAPFLADTSLLLNRWIDEGCAVLFEGAQGTLLDVDFGTYPYVTSSSSTAGGVCTGTGVGPTRIDGVLGVLKAYTTRVGGGPFPTELVDETGEYLRRRGHEFGTTTGRPRRCGWLDLVAARFARRINSVEAMALTKLDVLDTMEEIPVCVGYRLGGEVVREMPADGRSLREAEPVFEVRPGWRQETAGILDEEELPRRARDYVAFLEDEVEAKVALISTGPRREETLLTTDPVLRRWLGGEAVERVLEERGTP
jgi:adenylosuccinate synthase